MIMVMIRMKSSHRGDNVLPKRHGPSNKTSVPGIETSLGDIGSEDSGEPPQCRLLCSLRIRDFPTLSCCVSPLPVELCLLPREDCLPTLRNALGKVFPPPLPFSHTARHTKAHCISNLIGPRELLYNDHT